MSLRKKTLLILLVTFLLAIVAVLAVSLFIVKKGFSNLENEEMQRNMSRAVDTLQAKIDSMEALDRDWAIWDDTYQFIVDGNEDYIQSNLEVNDSFNNNQLNFMLYTNNDGQVVFAKAVDLNTREEIPVSESILALANDRQITQLDNEQTTKGVVMLPEGPVMIASVPILPNSGTPGPVRGALVFGCFLNTSQIEGMASITKLSTRVECLENPEAADLQQACAEITDQKPVYVNSMESGNIAAYTIIRDIRGQPAFVLQVDEPRSVQQQGDKTIFYLFISIVVMGVMLCLAAYLPLERFVISRIFRLGQQVSEVGQSAGQASAVTIEGRDEISHLAGDINGMLERLNNYQTDLKLTIESEQAQRQKLTQMNYSLENAQEKLALQSRELKAMSIHDDLTGLYNRRGFLALAEVQLNIAKRERQMLLLIYADVDDFKKINDTFGHLEGDKALKDIADLLVATARESDMIARLGGDEFVILASGIDEQSSDIFRQRLSEKLAVHNNQPGRKYMLSVSIGQVIFSAEYLSNLNEMIMKADRKMYEEKTSKKKQN
ncbi:MAG: diguanylate cyclase [Thermoleophilia bacterium]|nr:diguanylate cyclase [Thermoleophilia bacterium]